MYDLETHALSRRLEVDVAVLRDRGFRDARPSLRSWLRREPLRVWFERSVMKRTQAPPVERVRSRPRTSTGW